MAYFQFTDVQDRPTEFLDMTSLTLDEFQQLVPPFEAAFQAHMAAWRLDGKPRTARQFRRGAEIMSSFILLAFLFRRLNTSQSVSPIACSIWLLEEQAWRFPFRRRNYSGLEIVA